MLRLTDSFPNNIKLVKNKHKKQISTELQQAKRNGKRWERNIDLCFKECSVFNLKRFQKSMKSLSATVEIRIRFLIQ
jgi:hypothetical protein